MVICPEIACANVGDLARFGANHGFDALRPAPARFECHAAGHGVALETDDLEARLVGDSPSSGVSCDLAWSLLTTGVSIVLLL